MTINVTFDTEEYRKLGKSAATIERQMRCDVRRALTPLLEKLAQVIYTERYPRPDRALLETRLGPSDAGERYAAWMGLYHRLLDGEPLPADITQDDVIRALQEIRSDLDSGWLRRAAVRPLLPQIDKLCTRFRCLEWYDELAAAVNGGQVWPKGSQN